MRFWPASRRAFLHTLAALLATCLVWVIWAGWFVFIQGNYDGQSGGAWGTFAFAVKIGVTVSLILAGVFLLLIFFLSYPVREILRQAVHTERPDAGDPQPAAVRRLT